LAEHIGSLAAASLDHFPEGAFNGTRCQKQATGNRQVTRQVIGPQTLGNPPQQRQWFKTAQRRYRQQSADVDSPLLR
jgi:hypothetical protein